jgi:hypothetical protein
MLVVTLLAPVLTSALLVSAPPLGSGEPNRAAAWQAEAQPVSQRASASGDAPSPVPSAKPDPPKPDNSKPAPLPFVVPQPDRPEVAAMREALADLDDPDAAVRERARVSLMGMRRRDLPDFQKLVQESTPLAPAQAAVLKQVVVHVYLAGEPYETTGAQGFLGVRMQPTSVRIPGPESPDQTIPAVGVIIVERMPGFVGSRMLLDGDVILGVTERQDARMIDVFDFAAVIQSFNPGSTVHFQILRQGQVVRVPVTLDPKPIQSEAEALKHLVHERVDKAEDYWDKAFAKLLKEGVG